MIHPARLGRALHRRLVFGRAMKRFLAAPTACAEAGHPVLRALIYGWGNEAWSAGDEYLAAAVRHADVASGDSLECGSGLSTLLVGAVARARGRRHWALEHHPGWARRLRRALRRFDLASTVVLHEAPLRMHGAFHWYAPPLAAAPRSFSLVLCDGPPGDTPGGRFGLLPVMRDRLAPSCVILLDDAARPSERSVLARWRAEFAVSVALHGSAKPFARLTFPPPPAPDCILPGVTLSSRPP